MLPLCKSRRNCNIEKFRPFTSPLFSAKTPPANGGRTWHHAITSGNRCNPLPQKGLVNPLIIIHNLYIGKDLRKSPHNIYSWPSIKPFMPSTSWAFGRSAARWIKRTADTFTELISSFRADVLKSLVEHGGFGAVAKNAPWKSSSAPAAGPLRIKRAGQQSIIDFLTSPSEPACPVSHLQFLPHPAHRYKHPPPLEWLLTCLPH
jgi:hypothetical protein